MPFVNIVHVGAGEGFCPSVCLMLELSEFSDFTKSNSSVTGIRECEQT